MYPPVMPIKHQSDAYRNRDGVRFVCDGDVWNAREGDLRGLAKARVRELKGEGFKAFFEVQESGAFYRVFVEQRKYGNA